MCFGPQTSCENSGLSEFHFTVVETQTDRGMPEYSIKHALINSPIHTGDAQCCILLLVLLTITWLKGPLQCKVAIFPFVIKDFLEEIL